MRDISSIFCPVDGWKDSAMHELTGDGYFLGNFGKRNARCNVAKVGRDKSAGQTKFSIFDCQVVESGGTKCL